MIQERTPPHAEQAERAALGAMLSEPERVVPLAMLKMRLPEDVFFVPAHRRVCAAIYAMVREGRRGVDLVTMSEFLRDRGEFEEVGGSQFLDALVDSADVVANAEFYLDIIRQKYILRRTIETARNVESEAWVSERGDTLLKKIPERFVHIVDAVVDEVSNRDVMTEQIKGWRDAKEVGKGYTGLPTPWESMNQILGGLRPGLYIIAGRPSQGKTTLEDCIATYNASQGTPVARVTLDMNRRRLLARALCRKAGVSLPKLNAGYAGESQLAQIEEAAAVIAHYPMFINDTDSDIAAICTWARAQKLKNDIQLLTIDYVQQVQVSESKTGWDDNRRLTYVSSRLKALWQELDIPIIVLSQLSRITDKGRERTPVLSDLRGSGSLEQDAYAVFLLYKDRSAQETKQKRAIWADLAKQQDGETGTLPFWMRPHYFLFEEARLDAEGEFYDAGGTSHEDARPEWAL